MLKANKLWLGYGFKGGATHFISHYEDKATAGDHREGMIRVSGVVWYTNLEHNKRHYPLDLYKRYNPEEYPKYQNYDAIHIEKTEDIPMDYEGEMGVPVSFLEKYCPEQFEIIGSLNIAEFMPTPVKLGEEFVRLYRRQGGTGHVSTNMYGVWYYEKGGRVKLPYSRILIRKKQ